MGAKLAVVVSILVALLAIAEATTYTTITTTVEEEEIPSGQSQRRCSEQVRRQSLLQCSRYLSQRSGSPYEVGMEMEEVNPMGGQSQQQMRQCCEELKNIDQQCRCEAIREVVRRQQQGPEHEEQQMEQVVRKAQNLPQRCNFQQPQQCQIRV